MNEKITDKEILNLLENGIVDTEPLFVMAYHSFIRDPKLDIYEKLVFLHLKTYAGGKNSCFPGQTTIANDLKISRDKVIKTLKSLQKKGALLIINQKKENNRKTTNLYIIAKYDPEKMEFESASLEKYKCLQDKPIIIAGK